MNQDYGSEVEAIQARIHATRERIEAQLETLEDEVSRRFDGRAWIRANPAKAVGLGLALGLYFGLK
ncbi:MAG: hypothetical protein R3E66_19590 [bacterium]